MREQFNYCVFPTRKYEFVYKYLHKAPLRYSQNLSYHMEGEQNLRYLWSASTRMKK